MVDLLAVSQGLNAVKATSDIIKTMMGLRDASQLLDKTVELNSKILDVQIALNTALQEQAALTQTIRDLEAKIAGFETWNAEKERYGLTEVAPRRFAYALKATTAAGEPPHWICPQCYQQGKKSILQGFNSHFVGWEHSCHTCNLKINTGLDQP